MPDLSVLIPARNEQWLKRTIDDVLANMRGDTEIIAVLDGAWTEPSIPDHPRVTLLYHPSPIGQRASVNEAARLSRAKCIMKLDAHCAVDEGFDVKLMYETEYELTQIPRMYNLHVFDWVCLACHHRMYQGGAPAKCEKCNGNSFEIDIIWKPRLHKRSDFARFDKDLHFQYWKAYEHRPESAGDIADVMCFVGACFCMERDRFWELGGLDEGHGSWGQMGVEIACKSWLSGGRMVVNKKTWFAHLFRTQPGFGFPYEIHYSEQEAARQYSKRFWNLENPDELPRWDKAIYPLRYVVDKFAPVPDWHEVLAAV